MEFNKRPPHLFLAVRALHVDLGALFIQMLPQILDAYWVLELALVKRATALYHLGIHTVWDDVRKVFDVAVLDAKESVSNLLKHVILSNGEGSFFWIFGIFGCDFIRVYVSEVLLKLWNDIIINWTLSLCPILAELDILLHKIDH